jgi:hypothetical protein
VGEVGRLAIDIEGLAGEGEVGRLAIDVEGLEGEGEVGRLAIEIEGEGEVGRFPKDGTGTGGLEGEGEVGRFPKDGEVTLIGGLAKGVGRLLGFENVALAGRVTCEVCDNPGEGELCGIDEGGLEDFVAVEGLEGRWT